MGAVDVVEWVCDSRPGAGRAARQCARCFAAIPGAAAVCSTATLRTAAACAWATGIRAAPAVRVTRGVSARADARVRARDVVGITRDGARAPRARPRVVRIAIVGAVIGPSKIDRRPWDGSADVQAGIKSVASALGRANPYAAATSVLATLANKGTQPPDVMGYAELYQRGARSGTELPMLYRDSYTPMWPDAEFRGVDLDRDVRIRVALIDKDIVENDPIGVAEIPHADIEAALASAAIYPVRVAEQTANQILFINIAVSEE